MSIKKIRWSRVYESSEEELLDFLRARNIRAERYIGEAYSEFQQQPFPKDSTLWCAEGSLTLRTQSTGVSLQPGDGILIGAGTTYDLQAGISGYVIYKSN